MPVSCYQQLVSYIKSCKRFDSTYKEYLKTSDPRDSIILQDQVDLISDLKVFQLKQFQTTCPTLYDFTRSAHKWCPTETLKGAFPERR